MIRNFADPSSLLEVRDQVQPKLESSKIFRHLSWGRWVLSSVCCSIYMLAGSLYLEFIVVEIAAPKISYELFASIAERCFHAVC